MEGEQRASQCLQYHNGTASKVANVDFVLKGAAAFTAKAACVQGFTAARQSEGIELWIDADNACQ